MKATFLLHGGMLSVRNEGNDTYFRRLSAGLSDGDQVVFIGFARRNETERMLIYERDKQMILKQATASIQVVNAVHDRLIEQLRAAQAVHITGGDSPGLVSDIRQYPEFINALAGKLVGGSSAGACLFSTHYYSGDRRQVFNGLGTLPIRLRVHSDNSAFGPIQESLEQLKAHSPQLELVQIKECEWIVRELDV